VCCLTSVLPHWTSSVASTVHQGTTVDGKTFETFLGNDNFEKKVILKFDNFLHKSFGKKMF
jgi:hypothetical protein